MHTRIAPVAAPIVLWALLTGAAAQEFCVTCSGPDATYRCVIGGEATVAARNSRGQFLCITELAKAGGHKSCSAARGQATPCPGETRTVMFTVGDPGASPLEPLPSDGATGMAPLAPVPIAPPAPQPLPPPGTQQAQPQRATARRYGFSASRQAGRAECGGEFCQEDGRGRQRHRQSGWQRRQEVVGLRRLVVRRLLTPAVAGIPCLA